MNGPAGDGPRTIGPYRLVRRLGAGGMGRVYLGTSPSGRRVAVKVVKDEIADDPGFRRRFRREVELAMKVGGFWTAAVVDADCDGPLPWVASEYIEGPSLRERVEDGGALPPREVRALGIGLAEALASIHALGLVHRDLKPTNILLTDTGPRVIDFGISKALEGGTVLTRSGVVIGTPGFMSPEQATGAPVGTASDVFALGAVLAYAATGAEPFGSGTPVALLYRVVGEEPDLARVPDELRPFVAHCMAKDPGSRPTPAELVAGLAGLAPAAERPTAVDPAAPATRVDPAVPLFEAPPAGAFARDEDAGAQDLPYAPRGGTWSGGTWTGGPGGWATPDTSQGPPSEPPSEPTPEPTPEPPLELVDGGEQRFLGIRRGWLGGVLLWTAVLVAAGAGVATARGADVTWPAVLAVYGVLCAPALAYFWSVCSPFREVSELVVGPRGVGMRRGHEEAEIPWRHLEGALVSVGSVPRTVTLFCRFGRDAPVDPDGLPARKVSSDPPVVTFTMLAVDRAERNASCSEIHRALSRFAPEGTYRPHPKVLRRRALRETSR
ncbi:serine/threonine-protein kinase [Streptomyces sp. NPDC059506]|uniref:serine/threonine-protein kinase n=1 Tax=unclassified Streptomyces TaxID=2593676 RepID=UPI0022AAC5F4|nr:serine/threonine-protein kinase [Streptomyces sp. HB2AG]MCZ2525812.1 serine/threonine-protein kinase [Streptomyces sp. HB2AG]